MVFVKKKKKSLILHQEHQNTCQPGRGHLRKLKFLTFHFQMPLEKLLLVWHSLSSAVIIRSKTLAEEIQSGCIWEHQVNKCGLGRIVHVGSLITREKSGQHKSAEESTKLSLAVVWILILNDEAEEAVSLEGGLFNEIIVWSKFELLEQWTGVVMVMADWENGTPPPPTQSILNYWSHRWTWIATTLTRQGQNLGGRFKWGRRHQAGTEWFKS